MALAEFKDLCFDHVDPAAGAVFWAPVLGLTAERRGDETLLTGPRPQDTIWLNRVPEPKTVKGRVHLDVVAGSVAEVEARGAREVEVFERWTWLADPEGNDFCVFVRDELPALRLKSLVVDAVDPHAIAAWWAEVLDGTAGDADNDPWSWVEGISGGPFESIDFGAVPEPKTVKNRIHWDVRGEVQPLLDAGATLLRARDHEVRWHVLADPEGNEFCVFD